MGAKLGNIPLDPLFKPLGMLDAAVLQIGFPQGSRTARKLFLKPSDRPGDRSVVPRKLAHSGDREQLHFAD